MAAAGRDGVGNGRGGEEGEGLEAGKGGGDGGEVDKGAGSITAVCSATVMHWIRVAGAGQETDQLAEAPDLTPLDLRRAPCQDVSSGGDGVDAGCGRGAGGGGDGGGGGGGSGEATNSSAHARAVAANLGRVVAALAPHACHQGTSGVCGRASCGRGGASSPSRPSLSSPSSPLQAAGPGRSERDFVETQEERVSCSEQHGGGATMSPPENLCPCAREGEEARARERASLRQQLLMVYRALPPSSAPPSCHAWG